MVGRHSGSGLNSRQAKRIVTDLDNSVEPVLNETEKKLLRNNVNTFLPNVNDKFPEYFTLDPDSWNNIPKPVTQSVKLFIDSFRHLQLFLSDQRDIMEDKYQKLAFAQRR